MTISTEVLRRIRAVALALGELRDDAVFVGGPYADCSLRTRRLKDLANEGRRHRRCRHHNPGGVLRKSPQ